MPSLYLYKISTLSDYKHLLIKILRHISTFGLMKKNVGEKFPQQPPTTLERQCIKKQYLILESFKLVNSAFGWTLIPLKPSSRKAALTFLSFSFFVRSLDAQYQVGLALRPTRISIMVKIHGLATGWHFIPIFMLPCFKLQ